MKQEFAGTNEVTIAASWASLQIATQQCGLPGHLSPSFYFPLLSQTIPSPSPSPPPLPSTSLCLGCLLPPPPQCPSALHLTKGEVTRAGVSACRCRWVTNTCVNRQVEVPSSSSWEIQPPKSLPPELATLFRPQRMENADGHHKQWLATKPSQNVWVPHYH